MIIIRDIEGMRELRAVEELQKETWNVEDREILPAIHMIAAKEVGAILVGAFDGDELIGFVYGFPGFENGQRIIHSDMLAVRDQYRDQGLGKKLKLAQRDRALAQGIDRITWTFDPLRAKNAYLNLSQLGAVANRYLRNFYGETTSPLHSLGTDRLWVTWHCNAGILPAVSPASSRQIEIPTEISRLSTADALRWRDKIRIEFEEAFAKHYVAVGFERGEETSRYILIVQSQSRP